MTNKTTEPQYIQVRRDDWNQMYRDLTRLMSEKAQLQRDLHNIKILAEECLQKVK
ncbi:MAG: hypothetical protein MJZ26_11370 [Fibrobacter sp.]|nr:hypothetical protein [Fibrobacter sp.]